MFFVNLESHQFVGQLPYLPVRRTCLRADTQAEAQTGLNILKCSILIFLYSELINQRLRFSVNPEPLNL
jgi:hypothetical protein